MTYEVQVQLTVLVVVEAGDPESALDIACGDKLDVALNNGAFNVDATTVDPVLP